MIWTTDLLDRRYSDLTDDVCTMLTSLSETADVCDDIVAKLKRDRQRTNQSRDDSNDVCTVVTI